MDLFCVMQEPGSKGPAYRHADRYKRQADEAKEAQSGEDIL
jgi:hypothetical protein